MFIKVVSKKAPTGIPAAQVAVSPSVTSMGASQVIVNISALDHHSFPEMIASLRLSAAEARDLAARIATMADKADDLVANPPVDASGAVRR